MRFPTNPKRCNTSRDTIQLLEKGLKDSTITITNDPPLTDKAVQVIVEGFQLLNQKECIENLQILYNNPNNCTLFLFALLFQHTLKQHTTRIPFLNEDNTINIRPSSIDIRSTNSSNATPSKNSNKVTKLNQSQQLIVDMMQYYVHCCYHSTNHFIPITNNLTCFFATTMIASFDVFPYASDLIQISNTTSYPNSSTILSEVMSYITKNFKCDCTTPNPYLRYSIHLLLTTPTIFEYSSNELNIEFFNHMTSVCVCTSTEVTIPHSHTTFHFTAAQLKALFITSIIHISIPFQKVLLQLLQPSLSQKKLKRMCCFLSLLPLQPVEVIEELFKLTPNDNICTFAYNSLYREVRIPTLPKLTSVSKSTLKLKGLYISRGLLNEPITPELFKATITALIDQLHCNTNIRLICPEMPNGIDLETTKDFMNYLILITERSSATLHNAYKLKSQHYDTTFLQPIIKQLFNKEKSDNTLLKECCGLCAILFSRIHYSENTQINIKKQLQLMIALAVKFDSCEHVLKLQFAHTEFIELCLQRLIPNPEYYLWNAISKWQYSRSTIIHSSSFHSFITSIEIPVSNDTIQLFTRLIFVDESLIYTFFNDLILSLPSEASQQTIYHLRDYFTNSIVSQTTSCSLNEENFKLLCQFLKSVMTLKKIYRSALPSLLAKKFPATLSTAYSFYELMLNASNDVFVRDLLEASVIILEDDSLIDSVASIIRVGAVILFQRLRTTQIEALMEKLTHSQRVIVKAISVEVGNLPKKKK
ncbi:Uncharacterized protein QTN25_000472 [Entamoeba marina]